MKVERPQASTQPIADSGISPGAENPQQILEQQTASGQPEQSTAPEGEVPQPESTEPAPEG